MRVFTSGVKMLDRTRVCLMLVLVFVCSIDCSNTVDVAAKTEGLVSQIIASDRVQSVPISHDGPEIRIRVAEVKRGRVSRSATARNSTISFRHPSSLNEVQLKSAVTIEFNFTHIDKTNRTALNTAYREVRRKILDYLNRMKSTTASPTNSTTAAPNTTIVTATTATTTSTPPPPTTTTSVAEATTDTPTTAAITTVTTQSTTQFVGAPPINRKRRRRSNGGNNDTFTEYDLPFVDNDPEFDENGNLIITVFIGREGFDDLHLLYNAIDAMNKSGELEAVAPVVNIYRGLPPTKPTTMPLPMPTTMDDVTAAVTADTTMDNVTAAAVAGAYFQVWLPILLAIILLLVIFIFVYCWKATNKKVKDEDRKKMLPPLDSKPSPSNGQAPKPRILTDSDGCLVPMAQYSDEQNP